MMDGHIAALRSILDENNFVNTPIMAYAVKYASNFYGPFREAANSAPGKGDRKGIRWIITTAVKQKWRQLWT